MMGDDDYQKSSAKDDNDNYESIDSSDQFTEDSSLTDLYSLAAYGELYNLKTSIQQQSNLTNKPITEIINTSDSLTLTTILHEAAKNNQIEIMKYLLENNCDINPLDCSGFTPLIQAAAAGYIETVRFLLSSSLASSSLTSMIDHRDCDGRSALHWASMHKHFDCIQALIAAGANTKMADNEGNFPSLELTEFKSVNKISSHQHNINPSNINNNNNNVSEKSLSLIKSLIR